MCVCVWSTDEQVSFARGSRPGICSESAQGWSQSEPDRISEMKVRVGCAAGDGDECGNKHPGEQDEATAWRGGGMEGG